MEKSLLNCGQRLKTKRKAFWSNGLRWLQLCINHYDSQNKTHKETDPEQSRTSRTGQ
ncbi:MAG: hypothetical protein IKG37_04340 [Solobacterium sp.]|nr:hypothetical protein [Solobacterium sp.]